MNQIKKAKFNYSNILVSLFVCVLLTMLISSACNIAKKVNVNNDPDICESMTYTNQQFSEITSDYYTLDSVFIVNNCLNIWVSYSGGCGDSDFKLFYTNKVIKSKIPKTNILLQLTDNDDCRAIVQQKLFYNLSFFEEYAEGEGITIQLSGIGKSVIFKNEK